MALKLRGGLFSNPFGGLPRNYDAKLKEFLRLEKGKLTIGSNEYNEWKEFFEDFELWFAENGDSIEDDDPAHVGTIEPALRKYKLLTDDRSQKKIIRDYVETICGGNAMHGKPHADQAMIECYYPEEFNKNLPIKGGWVLVTSTNLNPAWGIQRFGVYFVKPVFKTEQITPYPGNKTYSIRSMKAKIITEAGETFLFPYEYTRVDDIQIILADIPNAYDMVQLGGGVKTDEHKIHYLKTRGAEPKEIYMMLLNSVNAMDFCYFRMTAEATRFYEFYWDCMGKGIRHEMAINLWHHKEAGTELFNLKEVTNDKNTTKKRSHKKC